MVFRLRNLGLMLALTAVASAAWAQGTQTGTLTGRVESADGQALPGVTVAVSAPSLQGERTAQTTPNGDYIFKGLPAGRYHVTFTMSGFTTVERTTSVELAQSSTVNATLSLASVQESVTVTADAPSALETTQTGATLTGRDVDTLATGRNLEQIADLAPGLTDNTPNAGQVTIAGGFAYDNVFMLDGVDITDSTFGSPNDVFIEDAIEETQVITSGISAEFGRFGGGVINAITKRGGNAFSGTFRTDFTNPGWRALTPFEKDNDRPKPESDLQTAYQATLGELEQKWKKWLVARK